MSRFPKIQDEDQDGADKCTIWRQSRQRWEAMSDYDYDSYDESPAPPIVTPHPTILKQVTVVHLDPVGGTGYISHRETHALINIMDSYNASVESALKALGRHMRPGIKPQNVELLYSTWGLGSHKKVWVEFDPAEWTSIVKRLESFIGIREVIGKGPQEKTTKTLARTMPKARPDSDSEGEEEEEAFPIGHVWLAYGSKLNGRTTWTSVETTNAPAVDRPRSYQEALDYIKAVQTSRPHVFCSGGVDLESGKKLKFCTFISRDDEGQLTTDIWTDIPDTVRTDELAWRRHVPGPSQILGFTLNPDS